MNPLPVVIETTTISEKTSTFIQGVFATKDLAETYIALRKIDNPDTIYTISYIQIPCYEIHSVEKEKGVIVCHRSKIE